MKRNQITTENYKKFQHRACEFFPCHKGVPEDEFNCLFCYCPLYMLKDKCGGNFSYAHGIKDCSGCTKPHDRNAYEHVMSKIGLVIEGGKLSAGGGAEGRSNNRQAESCQNQGDEQICRKSGGEGENTDTEENL